MIPLLAHPCQRPGASIPLQVLPLFPRGASGSWELLLSHPPCFPGSCGRGIRACRALGAARSHQHRGCRSNIPCKTLWRSHCWELSLACTSTCVFRACGRTSMPAKVGIEQKERLTGSRKREQEKGDKARGPLGEIVTHKSDKKIHSSTQAAWGWIKFMGIAHHLPLALGICPGLSKPKGKP